MCNEIKYYYYYYYYSYPVNSVARSLRRPVNYDKIGVVHAVLLCRKEKIFYRSAESKTSAPA